MRCFHVLAVDRIQKSALKTWSCLAQVQGLFSPPLLAPHSALLPSPFSVYCHATAVSHMAPSWVYLSWCEWMDDSGTVGLIRHRQTHVGYEPPGKSLQTFSIAPPNNSHRALSETPRDRVTSALDSPISLNTPLLIVSPTLGPLWPRLAAPAWRNGWNGRTRACWYEPRHQPSPLLPSFPSKLNFDSPQWTFHASQRFLCQSVSRVHVLRCPLRVRVL